MYRNVGWGFLNIPTLSVNLLSNPLYITLSSPLKVVTLGCTKPRIEPASHVQPTVTAQNVGCLCVLALRGTTELTGNLQKWNALVSLILLFNHGTSIAKCSSTEID